MSSSQPPRKPHDASGGSEDEALPKLRASRENDEPPRLSANDLSRALPGLSQNERPTAAGHAERRSAVEFAGDRRALVAALANGNEGAAVALFHEYSSLVERTIGRIMGVDDELADATQEVFLRALRSVHKLRDPQALTDWILQITVCTATDWIRSRKRRRWLVFLEPRQSEAPCVAELDETSREALRATYSVFDRMPTEERTVFALRYIDGMELTQLAKATECSLATVKRRLQRASARFAALARREPALLPWLDRDQGRAAEEDAS